MRSVGKKTQLTCNLARRHTQGKNRLTLKSRAKFEITIRTDRQLVIRGSIGSRAWCPICGSETEAVSVTAASVVTDGVPAEFGVSPIAGELHLLPGDEHGQTRVCLRSLLEVVKQRSRALGIRDNPD
jgi:hypothetical protein